MDIKFRVFDTHLKTYTYNAHQYHEFIRWLSDSRYVCEQYIGLTDKNSKEIHKSDIIKSPTGDIFQVIYRNSSFVLKKPDGVTWAINFNLTAWEVIGNIHETPQLLQHGN